MRGWVFMITLLIVGEPLKAQELMPHSPKVYVSEDGKIYINKSLPAYFYISNSADPNSPKFLLQSHKSKSYTNPAYFSSEGRNTLRSPSAVDTVTKQVVIPKRDVEYQIYVDSKPPQTTCILEKPNTLYTKGNLNVTNSLIVSFASSDALSGVESVYVSVNGSAYSLFGNKLVLNEEKEYIIKYYAIDHTGNMEPAKENMFCLDKTPPVSTLKISGIEHEHMYSANTVLRIESGDQISGIRQVFVSIDDSIFKPYSSSINLAQLSQGNHKLWYYATDNVNNREQVNAYTFYIDKTPPQVIEEIQGKTFVANGKEFSAGTSKLKITAIDNKAGVKEIFYSINDAPFVKYEKPVILSDYKGSLLIKSYAVDNVGNISSGNITNSKTRNITYIDLSAPWVGHSLKGPQNINRDTVFINRKTAIILEAKDSESGVQKIEFQSNNGDLMKYTEPIFLNDEGLHRISVYGYDYTENLTRQEFSVVVDNTGPEIYEHFSSSALGKVLIENKEVVQYPSQTAIFLSATDFMSGFSSIAYELNNSKIQPYTGAIRNFSPGKINKLKVQAMDNLGNVTEKIIEFYIR